VSVKKGDSLSVSEKNGAEMKVKDKKQEEKPLTRTTLFSCYHESGMFPLRLPIDNIFTSLRF